MAASVVDLPEPVFPVTRIMPADCLHMSRTTSGILSSSSDSAVDGMARMMAPGPPRWRNTFTRKRASPSMA